MKKKIITLATLACLSCFCATLLTEKTTVSAQTIENDSKFYAVPGASVLLSDKKDGDADTNGIRFMYEMSVDTYQSLVKDMDAQTKEWKDGVSVTAYIVPTTRVSDTSSSTIIADEDTEARTIPANKWTLKKSEVQENTDVYVSYAYMYDFPDTEYKKDLASCAKLVGTETLTTSVQVRSMEYVATKALDGYAYGSDNYKSCLKYLDTFELTLGNTVYTAAKGAKLKGLPAVENIGGVTGAWTLADGTALTENTVWNYTENKTATVIYDATKVVDEVALCKYTYANENANYKTMNEMLANYNFGAVSAVYDLTDLATDKLDANGKLNPTAMANGTANVLAKVGDAYIKVPTITADGVLTNANQAKFTTIIDANLAGYYILDGDIAFTQRIKTIGKVNTTTYNDFTGTFDGRGYAMTNLSMGGEVSDWFAGTTSLSRSIFAVNSGTIKNVYVEFYGTTLTYDYAFVGQHRGTLLNVYTTVTFQTIPTNISSLFGTSALINKLYGSTTVKNCIGEVKLDSTKIVDTTQNIYVGTLVGATYGGTSVDMSNCYGILNGYNYKSDDGSQKITDDGLVLNYTNATFDYTGKMAALNTRANLLDKTFAESDGWLYWHKEADGLYFGTTKIVANS